MDGKNIDVSYRKSPNVLIEPTSIPTSMNVLGNHIHVQDMK